MVAIPIGPRQRFVVVASPDFIQRHGRPASPRALAGTPCIGVRFIGVRYRWEFVKDGEALQAEVDGPLVLGEAPLMVMAAQAGLGLSYLYVQYAEPGLQDGSLVQVLEDWTPEDSSVFLYYPGRRLVPAPLRAFIDLVQAQPARSR
jgi:DNA-binding transcriptional LysR family regulator